MKLLQRLFDIAGDRERRRDVLADVCRIDIDVNHACLRREGREFARDAIVKSDAQRDQQIAIRRQPCSRHTCRACPACRDKADANSEILRVPSTSA